MSIIVLIIILIAIGLLALLGMVAFIVSMKEDCGWAFVAGLIYMAICALSVWKLWPYIETFQ